MYRPFRELHGRTQPSGKGGRFLLIIIIYILSVISILFIDALYDAIQDNKYPLGLESKLHNISTLMETD